MVHQENGTPFLITANIPSTYTAAHAFNGIPLFSEITLTEITKGLLQERCDVCECLIRIYGAYKGEAFIKRELRIPDFRLSDYTPKGATTAVFDLSEFSLLPSGDFMDSVSFPVSTTVTVSVTIAGRASSRTFYIRLLPFGYLFSEMPYELVASYVLPGCTMAKRAKSACGSDSFTEPSEIIKRACVVASVMKKASLTYSPLMPELTGGECVIRDFDTVAFSNNRSMSLTEAVLLYCSMAEGAGLRPCAVFLKKDSNSIKALAGIHITDKKLDAVCQSITQLRDMVISGDIIFFDILGLLGTEQADFAKNASETSLAFSKTNSNLIFAFDVAGARELGVKSVVPAPLDNPSVKEHTYSDIGEAVMSVSENGRKSGLYGFSPYSGCSLGICAKANSLEFGKEYTVSAIDEEVLCSDPDSFSYISTYKTQNLTEHPRNITEQALFDSKVKRLFERIETERVSGGLCLYSAPAFLSGKKQTCQSIRDDVNGNVAILCRDVRNRIFSDRHVCLYAATGSVSFIRNGKKLYAPCAYVPCTLTVEQEYIKLRYGTDRAIFNLSLIDETESILGRPEISREVLCGSSTERQQELTALLSHYARLSNYDSEFTYHPDTFLSAFDLSPFLMRGCIESTDGKLFEEYLLKGEYPEKDTGLYFGRVDSIPFEMPSLLHDAVLNAENDSIVISGPHGSGKKAAAAGIAVRNHTMGEKTLICSKYSETLDSFMNVFKSSGLSELCLVIGDDIKTRKQMLANIKTLMTPVNTDEGFYDTGDYEEKIDSYVTELHRPRSFGYTLYECIDEYCKSCEKSCEEPLDINISLYDITTEGINELLSVSKALCDGARKLSKAATGSTIKELRLDKLRLCTPAGSGIKRTLDDASEQLLAFAAKSERAMRCLGIPNSALYDIRSMRAFGDFLESVIFSGVDFMPEKLLKDGIYSKARIIEEICPIIDELRSLSEVLSEFTEEISDISARNLYIKWQNGEGNIFIRSSVMRELKRFVPSTLKLNSFETGELLSRLSRREELTERYKALEGECEDILGTLWKGIKTDTETAKRAARFALLASSCSSRMFRTGEPCKDIRDGIALLIESLKENGDARSELLLAVGAFRRLIGSGDSVGLLDSISKSLSVDLYDMRFEEGILSASGLAALFSGISNNSEVLALLPDYNELKKRAEYLGISSFANIAENMEGDGSCEYLFRKSIFHFLAKSVINSEQSLCRLKISDIENYIKTYKLKLRSTASSVISEHREAFMRYIETPSGKSELDSLCREIKDLSYTSFELLARHSEILGIMYSIILSTTYDAYRLPSYPSVLILADCEKTDAAEAIPICACFDRCIFLSGDNLRKNSIIDYLPGGMPLYRSDRVLCEKNSCISQLVALLGADIEYTKGASFGGVHFVKCEGGMYDRNTRTNRIEALTACETAVAVCEKEGYDSTGILASTQAQCAEIIQILGVLANKHAKKAIAEIPVRYIGNVGDFSKRNIVLSVAFGKNVYSVTRSFGIFDYCRQNNTFPDVLHELLCTEKNLYVVSSVMPSDIQTDTLGKGASVIASILSFALYGVIPKKLQSSDLRHLGGIEGALALEITEDGSSGVTASGGIISTDKCALIYNMSPELPIYDRTVLPINELIGCGYKAGFVLPTELLKSVDEQ